MSEEDETRPTRAECVVAELAARGWVEVDNTALNDRADMRSWTKNRLVFHLRTGHRGRVCGAWAFRGNASDVIGATAAHAIGVTRGRDKFGQAMALLEHIDQLIETEPAAPGAP